MEYLTASNHRLEYEMIPATDPSAPTLVFLHEGLGSAGLWRDFPARLAAATGSAALVYSRYGYGRSDPLTGPRAIDYLHVEALESLPSVLDQLGIHEPILIGHSDGASIALIHAAAAKRPVRGIICEAPHVFVEEITLSGIRDAAEAWRTTDLTARLAKHHVDANKTFWGWNDTWLQPSFRHWNIEALLPSITCPTLVIQGIDDEYGTPAQVEAIAAQVGGPVETVLLPDCGHTPHRDQADEVLSRMAAFVAANR
jgi:pimeloyl-ACP methyl ester carboxylesterase